MGVRVLVRRLTRLRPWRRASRSSVVWAQSDAGGPDVRAGDAGLHASSFLLPEQPMTQTAVVAAMRSAQVGGRGHHGRRVLRAGRGMFTILSR